MSFTNNTEVQIITNGGYTLEQILANKNCSKDPKYWYPIANTDRYLFKSSVAESWEFFYPTVENPIRNTNQIYLRFTNSLVFQSEANFFKEQGVYTHAMEGTMQYEKYWDEQEDYCFNGKEIDGVRITGRHYFSINFGRIQAIPTDSNGNEVSTTKVETFLRFLDHQYYIFNELDEAFLEGIYGNKELFLQWYSNKTELDYLSLKKTNFAAVKSRRKGFSYLVDNGVYAYEFSFIPYSRSYLFAYQKNAYETTLSGILNTLNFTNEFTEFGKQRQVLNKRDHFRASFKLVNEDGREIEKGFKSEFQAVSFKDSPFKAVGASASKIGVEEAGVFDNLLETYSVSIEPLIRDGENFTGNCVVWGSSGDMEGGGSLSLREMIYRPAAYNFKEYDNIYEESYRPEKVAWFIDDLWYAPSKTLKSDFLKLTDDKEFKKFVEINYDDLVLGVDKQGNSHRWVAKPILEAKRKVAKTGSQRSYQKLITQQPLYLTDAFLISEHSPFDTLMAQEALGELVTSNKMYVEPGTFSITKDNSIVWNPNPMLKPLLEWPTKTDQTDGCWVIYNNAQVDRTLGGRFLASLDPIDFGYDETGSNNSHSLAAAYVIDSITRNIVAEYVGRPKTAEIYFEQLWRGIEYFDAQLLYENNLKGLFSYLRTKNKLYLLADEPASLKDKWGYKNNNRIKGFHATQQINSYGRELINKWSTEEVTVGQHDNGEFEIIPRMFLIPSKGLLQEMIAWHPKGNFDRISSLGALMFILFDREYITDNISKNVKSFFDSSIFIKIKKLKRFK